MGGLEHDGPDLRGGDARPDRPLDLPAGDDARTRTSTRPSPSSCRSGATGSGGGFQAVRIIGERWSPRSQQLRDLFTRNRIPIGFYDADSDRGRGDAAAPRAGEPAAARRPAAFAEDSPALQDPTDLDIALAFGLMQPVPEDEVFDVVDRRRRSRRPRSRRLRGVGGAAHPRRRAGGGRAGRPGRARSSATTWASPPVSAATASPSAPSSRPGRSVPPSSSCGRRPP